MTTTATPRPSRLMLFPRLANPISDALESSDPPDAILDEMTPASPTRIKGLEEALIAQFLLGANLQDLDVLKAEDFQERVWRQVAQAVIEIRSGLHSPIESIDTKTVVHVAKLSDADAEALHGLSDRLPMSREMVRSYVAILKEESAARAFMAAIHDIQRISSESGSTLQKMSKVQGVLERARIAPPRSKVSIGQACIETIDDAIGRFNRDVGLFAPVMTGIHDLDALTGGLQAGDVIVLAARPSVGKTTAALTIATNAAKQGRRVKFVSLEMTRQRLARRILASEAEVDSHVIKSGALSKEEWEAIADATLRLADVPLHLDDDVKSDCEAILSAAIADAESNEMDLLVIDYFQLMEMLGGRSDNRSSSLGQMSRSIKKAALRMQRPILLLSQLNRLVTQRADPRPVMSDLRESGAIEQDADVILMLFEEAKDKDNLCPEIEILVEKNRDGPKGTVIVKHQKPFNKFTNLETRHV